MNLQTFHDLLESTIVPSSMCVEQQIEVTKPLNDFLTPCFPIKLYKYRRCCENHISAFYKDQVWAASPQEMNDGFDARMFFDKNEVLNNVLDKMNDQTISSFIQSLKNDFELQKQIFQVPGGYDALANLFLPDHYIEAGIKSARSELIPEICKMMDNLPGITQQSLKISCFSEAVTSTSMWGQYAENETGFCLEYNFESNNTRPQSSDGNYIYLSIYPVIYQPERFRVASSFIEYLIEYQLFFRAGIKNNCHVDISKLQGHINNYIVCPDLFIATKIALHKSIEWEYEKEWRLFCSSNDVAFRTVGSVCFIKKPTAIYLGRRISETNEKILTVLGREKGIPVYKMKLDDTSASYDLVIENM